MKTSDLITFGQGAFIQHPSIDQFDQNGPINFARVIGLAGQWTDFLCKKVTWYPGPFPKSKFG
jgi:hypothetical protein